jgi:hypothetical protein
MGSSQRNLIAIAGVVLTLVAHSGQAQGSSLATSSAPPPRLWAAKVGEVVSVPGAAEKAEVLDFETTLERMIDNTDDAYGFPPFRYLASAITIGGLGYQQLRQREREILGSFLSHVRARAVASDSFGWADEIPKLIGTGGAAITSTSLSVMADGAAASGEGIWPRWQTKLARGIA